MLWMANLIHDSSAKPDDILAAADQVIAQLQSAPPSQALVDRALVKFRSAFYAELTQFGGVGRANYMASLSLFNDNPALINSIEPNLRKVTPALIQSVAKEYLRKSNRTVLTIQPGAGQPTKGKSEEKGGAR